MKKAAIIFLTLLMLSFSAFAQEKEQQRLKNAGEVLTEILGMPDSVPKYWLDRAECVLVFPSVKKFAIGLGGNYGRGAMSCRSGATFTGPWGPPAMMALEGANIGFQLGGQATDFVLLVVNPSGVRSILRSKVKLGGDASAAAGPKGRDAEAATDVTMHTEILTYSRSRGLFAGISLEGSTLRQDNGANEKIYGRKVSAHDIVLRHAVSTTAAGRVMLSALERASPRNLSDPRSLRPESNTGSRKRR
ncbi:MAG: lipid-binding SYLF domain-containing protein [Actinomycetota bacterium]